MSLDFVEKLDFNSDYFDLYKLSNSAYGAISKKNSGMGSNAGFIDLGKFSIVIDTTLSEGAANDLKKAVIQYTKKEPNLIVTTHFHMDHVIGNSVFPLSTLIITSERTRKNILTENPKRIEDIKNTNPEEVAKMENTLKTEQDEEKRKEIENDLLYIRNIQAEDFSFRGANVSFEQQVILYGEKITVQLRTFQKAHTDGDVIVYIPEEKVLFAGDLLFAKVDPWLGSGDPEGWISLIDEKLIKMDYQVVVPGHGQLASKYEFELEKKYIKEIMDLAKKYKDAGEEPTKIKREDFSEELQSWKSNPILEWNTNFLAEFLKKQEN